MGIGYPFLPGEPGAEYYGVKIRPVPKSFWVCITLGITIIVALEIFTPKKVCDDWWYWYNAQEKYESDPLRYGSLDKNKDGTACEKQRKQQSNG